MKCFLSFSSVPILSLIVNRRWKVHVRVEHHMITVAPDSIYVIADVKCWYIRCDRNYSGDTEREIFSSSVNFEYEERARLARAETMEVEELSSDTSAHTQQLRVPRIKPFRDICPQHKHSHLSASIHTHLRSTEPVTDTSLQLHRA